MGRANLTLRLRKLAVVLLAAVIFIGASGTVWANDDTTSIYRDTPYYDDSTGCSGIGSAPIVSTSNVSDANRAYNGEEIYNQAQLDTIAQQQAVYEEAGEAVGIPWQAIAVLHNQEHGLQKDNPDNGQGAFQLYSYTAGGTNSNAFRPAGPIDDAEFLRQAKIAAEVLKGKTSGDNAFSGADSSEAAVKNAFFGYNGTAGVYKDQAAALGYDRETEGFEGSPYVVNKVDAQRDPNTAAPGTWGQIKSDGGSLTYPANTFFGAWVQYGAIAGIVGGSGCEGDVTSGPFVQRVLEIAEREFRDGNGENLQASGKHLKYSDGVDEAWCADFASWVFNEAGSPFTDGASGGWRIAGVSTMKAWFEQNGEYHTARTGYTPRPGDVVIYEEGMMPYPNHVNIVVSVEGDTITTIGGNETDGIRKSDQNINAPYITGYGTKTE